MPQPYLFAQALNTGVDTAASGATATAALAQGRANWPASGDRAVTTGTVAYRQQKAAAALPASALTIVPPLPREFRRSAKDPQDTIDAQGSTVSALESATGFGNPFVVQQLPSLGDGSGGELTPQAERKLGERVMREIRSDPDYIDDWLLVDYLDSVSYKLAVAAQDAYLGVYVPQFEVFGVRDPQINAFSLPGGFIGMNTGLIQVTQTESELASVLGHEMGHVLQRHIARMIGQQRRTGYAALAGLLFGALAGLVAHSADLGEALVLGSQALAVDNQLRFSRSAEHEADRVGFRMLEGAGYDPYAMAEFFRRLEKGSSDSEVVPAYARTHPLTTERIADMEDRARRAPYRQPTQNPEYAFVRARAQVLQANWPSDLREVVRRMRGEIHDQTSLYPAGSWYGVAFAELRLNDFEAANAAFENARQLFREQMKNPQADTPSLAVMAARLASLEGRDADALRLADAARRVWPKSNAVIDVQLDALLRAHRYEQAQGVARLQTVKEPEQSAWWSYLAQSSSALGDSVAAHRAMAERLALRGAWPAATEHLKEARAQKGINFYEASAIEARLHQMEAQYKEDKQEKDVLN
ncbi:Beta-barrel assembly-enhancing protease [Pararobbsia alpina]|uniref:Beta-barrel assembly-enhancing protease n=2 Tax=Pararobbsia alpina TaxID=621374 RepID=A0A6S7AX11_9BURK|nr:M48 family metalloprotease [Pararobbsia alpina]CAB3780294.1 Beta-barrel assembly-enhancing protease [Pararobbsia alpina]